MARVAVGSRGAGSFAASTRASLRDVQRNLTRVVKDLEEAGVRALKYALKPMKERADYYCPKDTGALVQSGYLEVRRQGRHQIQAEIGYARGGKPFYAAYVHERLDVSHAPPTRAKWLQIAVQEKLGSVPRRVRQYLKGVVR